MLNYILGYPKHLFFSVLSLILIIGNIYTVSASEDMNFLNFDCPSNGTFYIWSKYDNFDFSLRYVPTSGYHWRLDENALYRVELIGQYLVLDNDDPQYFGSPLTMHFIFYFTSKNN